MVDIQYSQNNYIKHINASGHNNVYPCISFDEKKEYEK